MAVQRQQENLSGARLLQSMEGPAQLLPDQPAVSAPAPSAPAPSVGSLGL